MQKKMIYQVSAGDRDCENKLILLNRNKKETGLLDQLINGYGK